MRDNLAKKIFIHETSNDTVEFALLLERIVLKLILELSLFV